MKVQGWLERETKFLQGWSWKSLADPFGILCSSSFSWMGRVRTSVNEDFLVRSEVHKVLYGEHRNKGTQRKPRTSTSDE